MFFHQLFQYILPYFHPKGVRDPKNGMYKQEMHSIKSFEKTQETYIIEANLKELTNLDQH